MALDFVILNQHDEPIKTVPIGIESHGRLFYAMPPSKFPTLERMRGYYEYARFEQSEYSMLVAELTSLKELHSQCEGDINLLDSMLGLVREAEEGNQKIEAIAD